MPRGKMPGKKAIQYDEQGCQGEAPRKEAAELNQLLERYHTGLYGAFMNTPY